MKAVSEGVGVARVISEFVGRDMRVAIWADASAALGMIDRGGVGKVRHVDVGIRWLHHKWLKNQVHFNKVPGKDNVSDLMTKGLGREQKQRNSFEKWAVSLE